MPFIETDELIRWLGKAFMLGREGPSDLVQDFFFDFAEALKVRNLYATDIGDPPDSALRRIGPDNAPWDTPRDQFRRVQPGQNIGTRYWQAFAAANDETSEGGFTGRNAQMYCRAVGAQTPTSSGGEYIIATTPVGSTEPVDRIRVASDGLLDFGGCRWRVVDGWYELAILTPGGATAWMKVGPT